MLFKMVSSLYGICFSGLSDFLRARLRDVTNNVVEAETNEILQFIYAFTAKWTIVAFKQSWHSHVLSRRNAVFDFETHEDRGDCPCGDGFVRVERRCD